MAAAGPAPMGSSKFIDEGKILSIYYVPSLTASGEESNRFSGVHSCAGVPHWRIFVYLSWKRERVLCCSVAEQWLRKPLLDSVFLFDIRVSIGTASLGPDGTRLCCYV